MARVATRRPAPQMNQTSLPAAVGGWNARDPWAEMDPRDAIVMDNWFPGAADIEVRGGYASHATGMTGQIQTLMTYTNATTAALFAAVGTEFYAVTSAGAVGAAAVTGLSNAQWYWLNMRTAGGAYLYAANGADSPRLYDGAAWTAITGASTPAITGVTTTTLIYPFLWKRRLWFVQKDTMSAWYLPVDSVGGAASEINFGPLFSRGGYLVAGMAMTIDAGEGMDDYLVLITSRGQVALYAGTDPASASTFALRGVFDVSPPVGRRCLMRYGGDVIAITRDGFLPLSSVLPSSQTGNRSRALSDKIRDAVSSATASYGSTYGWEATLYPDGPAILFNVPTAVGSQQQYVMNTVTGQWCRFTGWAANCFALLNDALYFGGANVVYKAWTTNADAGVAIPGEVMHAYNYYGSRGRVKHFKLARPVFVADGSPSISMAMNVDFEDDQPTAPVTISSGTAGVWDSATWDNAVWGGTPSVRRDWQGIGNIGTAGALRLRSSSSGIIVRWSATDVLMEVGGVL